ncbi:IS982 family transposase [Gelidibacter salicanalis]|uniref:IS982 family transposase n=1 Tax=Gelidibacter salicanalis TaxID=291193 RepID=A0A934NK67_9FLAO|nr:IS982 family transposase [Gelidibacter salicanalis]MBJ7882794.1 IS982 family transposase [Gelidibacter salicanalis]
MISKDRITEIFCSIDDFCLVFDPALQKRQLSTGKMTRKRKFTMSTSEIVTITVLFHLSGIRTFKHFYIHYVQSQLQNEFPNTVSFNRFIEVMQSNILPLTLYMKTCCLGECTGISFVDSTPIRACGNKRITQNKVFKGIATVGKSTMGWFYGFKLHIIVNDKGELLDFVITQANVDDRAPLKEENFLKKIFGRLYGDKGYLSKELAALLFDKGLHLVTGIRNNMKNVMMTMRHKILLRKRSVIEIINDQLKNIAQADHSRHRSFGNFITNLVASLIAYSFQEKKPSIKFETENTTQLSLFY